ncbi:MAG: chromate transporter [Chthoniobacterales bacterium]|nr:chromate transporter [Chthoniobacterales bacterium]
MNKTLLQLAGLFSSLSLSAFGGGKVVLPSMHQASVGEYHWMTNQEFVDLFSISMAAPGPSMMVVTLVGLKACLPYGTAIAILGALVATLAMFVPSSILVYFAGNWWDHWKESPWRHSVMNAILPISTGLILAATWIIAKTSIHSLPTAIMGVVALILMLFTKINPVLMMGAAGLISWVFLR